MHDPLSVRDLVHDELEQRRLTGYDVSALAEALDATEPDDAAGLEQIYDALPRSERRSDWGYDEPETWADIEPALPPPANGLRAASLSDLEDRILGGWQGRIAGCNMGKPFETGSTWTPARIRAYLELASAYPLRDFVPVIDPMPEGFALHPDWPVTTRGRVHGSARDDDIDYAILALHLLERHGPALSHADIALAWLGFLPYLRVFTAERVVYANLLRGVAPERAADVRNPYREWIGALIRGDVFGWVLPGDPGRAARMAHVDASLSHRGNGVYGELWSAALVSCAMVTASVPAAYTAALAVVPTRSRLAELLSDVQQLYAEGAAWEDAVAHVRDRFGHYPWVHTVNNAGVIAAGLLWGEGDFAATVGLTVQGGWDTDSNGATAGSVVGTVLGAKRLPRHLVDPLEDRVRSAVFGYDNVAISELASRTATLARRWTQ